MKLDTLLAQLETAHGKYMGKIGSVEQALQDVADFDLSVFYQPSDGFVVCGEHSSNAPLDACIEIVKRKGKLSQEDYDDVRI